MQSELFFFSFLLLCYFFNTLFGIFFIFHMILISVCINTKIIVKSRLVHSVLMYSVCYINLWLHMCYYLFMFI